MAILTIAGWLFAVALAALCALTAAQQDHQAYTGALGCGCALVGTLGLLGVLPAVVAVGVGVLAALAIVGMVALTPLQRDDGTPDFTGELTEARKRVAGAATGGLGAVWRAWRGTRRRKAHPGDELAPRRGAKAAAAPPSARPASAPAPRAVPPARKNPAPAPAPLPHAVVQGRVSMAWAQVISGIAEFEPETDTDFLEHWREQAAGLVGVADAMLDQADYLSDGVGLAPVIVGSVFDGADAVSDSAQSLAMIREQCLRAYAGSREDASNGHHLPKDGRWVTGEDAG